MTVLEKLEKLEKYQSPIWHPCSQMKDYENFPPLAIARAYGSYLELTNGKKIIDAISSWWCKSLGHAHPRLSQALQEQMSRFEHVIFANTTHDTIVALSHKLMGFTKILNKIFYAGDGSCAVEIALKMSVHARQLLGQSQKTQFISLQNSYHGETVGALSVSDVGLYRTPYSALLFKNYVLSPIPYVQGIEDPLWQDATESWQVIEKKLEPLAKTTTAIIVEPIVQGAGGMKIYSQDFLKRLRAFTTAHDIHLIADECMTGMGRTGKMLACEHSEITPDFLCLSKGLTAGWLPFSAVLTSDALYDLFYDDYVTGKAFLHSHTYSGHALGASLANAVLDIFSEENLCDRAVFLNKIMTEYMYDIADYTHQLKNIRSIGALVAADLIVDTPGQRRGFEIFKKATELGAYLRPLGNTIYWLPPLNVSVDTLQELKRITEQAIVA